MRYHLNKIARILQFFLLIDILFCLFLIALDGVEGYVFATYGASNLPWDPSLFHTIKLSKTVFDLALLFPAFLFWIYRATHNMQRQFGRQSISAGWAVGWNFIPLANFFMVYRAMANLWRHFSPNPYRRGFLLTWWLLEIFITLADAFCDSIQNKIMPTDANIILLSILEISVFIGYSIAIIMEMRIITLITRGEEKARDAMAGVFA